MAGDAVGVAGVIEEQAHPVVGVVTVDASSQIMSNRSEMAGAAFSYAGVIIGCIRPIANHVAGCTFQQIVIDGGFLAVTIGATDLPQVAELDSTPAVGVVTGGTLPGIVVLRR